MKYRHELKYFISESDICVLQQQLRPFMVTYPNQGEYGYTISSVYFDTPYNRFLDENEAGISLRDKVRIRTYNHDYSKVKLEIKSKNNALCIKKSCNLSPTDYQSLMHYPYAMNLNNLDNEVLSKVALMNATCVLQPVVIVEYDRYALVHNCGNVRITFDRNIRASRQVENFNQAPLCIPVLDQGQHILEVKYDDILPNYIASILDTMNLNQTAFSKYQMCRLTLGC